MNRYPQKGNAVRKRYNVTLHIINAVLALRESSSASDCLQSLERNAFAELVVYEGESGDRRTPED